jgi:hypothetical protein
MATIIEDIKHFVKKNFKMASERIDEEATLWNINRQIENLEKQVTGKKMEIGTYVYQILQSNASVDLKQDAQIASLVKTIEEVLTTINAKQTEYEQVRKEAAERRTAPTAASGETVVPTSSKPEDSKQS